MSEELHPENKRLLDKFIVDYVRPRSRVSASTSYGMKHVYESYARRVKTVEIEGNYYVTNDQFKRAMLDAGYQPVNPQDTNWSFFAKVTIDFEGSRV